MNAEQSKEEDEENIRYVVGRNRLVVGADDDANEKLVQETIEPHLPNDASLHAAPLTDGLGRQSEISASFGLPFASFSTLPVFPPSLTRDLRQRLPHDRETLQTFQDWSHIEDMNQDLEPNPVPDRNQQALTQTLISSDSAEEEVFQPLVVLPRTRIDYATTLNEEDVMTLAILAWDYAAIVNPSILRTIKKFSWVVICVGLLGSTPPALLEKVISGNLAEDI